jgi:hypothetical protein
MEVQAPSFLYLSLFQIPFLDHLHLFLLALQTQSALY